MKIKNGFVLKKVMGSYMIVSTEDSTPGFNSMQTMNETGAFLWDLLTEDTSIDTLVTKMTAEYEIDEDTAKKDIVAFIDKLRLSSLLDE